MKNFWNDRYAADEYAYGEKPNQFFRAEIDRLAPGKLLLPAEGEGRNAVYAASLGWEVYAFDYSEEARKKALKLAARRGVEINYQIATYETVELPAGDFDCLALIYAHTPGDKRRVYHRKLAAALKPGGTLLLEGFSKKQLGRGSGGPKDLAMLFSEEEMVEDFGGLLSLEFEEVETDLDEGAYHRGKAMVLRAVGKRVD